MKYRRFGNYVKILFLLSKAKYALPERSEKIMAKTRRDKWIHAYLILGEMSPANDSAANACNDEQESIPPVLMLDESDKFRMRIEGAMLMPLGRGLIYVPRLKERFISVSDWQQRSKTDVLS